MSYNRFFHFDGNVNLQFDSLYKTVKNNFTYEFWIKPEEDHSLITQSISGGNGARGQRYVIFPGHPEDSLQAGVGVSVGTNGVTVLEHSSCYFPATLVHSINLEEETHIAIVYREKTPFLYINGEFVKKGYTSPKENVYASGTIGGIDPYGYFVGKMRNLRIWDHPRNKQLINDYMNKEIIGDEKGLVLNWSGYEGTSIYNTVRNNFTYEFWVKPEEDHNMIAQSISRGNGARGQRFVIFPGHPGDPQQAGVGVSVGTNGVTVLEHSSRYFPATLVHSTKLEEETHIAIVYKEKTPFLYINGEFVKKGYTSPKEDIYASGTIGGIDPYGFFVGKIRHLRIWDHPRNKQLINDYMNKGIVENEEGLVLNWSGYPTKHSIASEETSIKISKEQETSQNERFIIGEDNIIKKQNMKIISFYLPQFHEIPENNQWWGNGFTEWTNTRKAKPLFPGHNQPREPYQNFYYDLTNPSVRKWQADLAKKYGIYGFCYYHYWFKGKRLLEKPFNEVLRTGEPDFPFCLSWANEPWTRRWDGRNDQVLMQQNYGDKKDWKEHFYYLLKAFQDERYIRIEGKPLFLIYRPESIPNISRMLEFWESLAKENGLKGIYFVKTLHGHFPLKKNEKFNASVEFEPHYTIAHTNCRNIRKKVNGYKEIKEVIDYDSVWSCILNRKKSTDGTKIIPGAFIDWDNTARRGAKATIYQGATPEKFEKYLSKQLKRAKTVYQSDFLFINAWNEWAEGTYLEPDKRYQFSYLEAVKKSLQDNGYY